MPIPATLVVGKDGRVKARLVDPDFRHRMGIEEIRRALAASDLRRDKPWQSPKHAHSGLNGGLVQRSETTGKIGY